MISGRNSAENLRFSPNINNIFKWLNRNLHGYNKA